MIPAESGLQRSFPLPNSLQQFCDAGTWSSPEPPQMLPGGLHAVPPEQTWLSLVLGSQYGV
jgi:hypothetical protein